MNCRAGVARPVAGGRPAAVVFLMIAWVAGCGGPRGITVVEGTYGGNCGVKAGNATTDLAKKCDTTQQCDYKVDVNTLGDPSVGCAKDFLAVYRCGDERNLRRATASPEAGMGSTVKLTCS